MPYSRHSESNRLRRSLLEKAKSSAVEFRFACIAAGDAAVAAVEPGLTQTQYSIRALIADDLTASAAEK